MNYGQTVYKTGDPAIGVWIIISGQFEVQVKNKVEGIARTAIEEASRPGVKNMLLKKAQVQ